MNQVADDLLGDEGKGIPSMKEEMSSMKSALRNHLDWHGDSGGHPARPDPLPHRVNGGVSQSHDQGRRRR